MKGKSCERPNNNGDSGHSCYLSAHLQTILAVIPHSIRTLRFIFHTDLEIMIPKSFSNNLSELIYSSIAERGCMPRNSPEAKTQAN